VWRTVSRKSNVASLKLFPSQLTCGDKPMDKVIELLANLFYLTKDQQIFFIAVSSLLLAGFSLFVVLAAVNKLSGKGGE